jgi:hypothetical protein
MRNTLSDNKLYGHEKASHYGTPDLTVPSNDRKTRSRRRMARQKPYNRNCLFECPRWSVKREADLSGESYAAVVNRAFALYFSPRATVR